VRGNILIEGLRLWRPSRPVHHRAFFEAELFFFAFCSNSNIVKSCCVYSLQTFANSFKQDILHNLQFNLLCMCLVYCSCAMKIVLTLHSQQLHKRNLEHHQLLWRPRLVIPNSRRKRV